MASPDLPLPHRSEGPIRYTTLLVTVMTLIPVLGQVPMSLRGPGAAIRITAPGAGLATARATLVALEGDTLVFRRAAEDTQ
jgi:hypothetical protein